MTDTTDTATPPAAPGNAAQTIDMSDWSDSWAGMTVTVRPHLSFAADQRIESARMRMAAEVKGNRRQRRSDDGADVEMTTTVTPLDYATAVVEETVTSWTLVGFDGQPLQANRAGVTSEQAPADLLDCVIEAIVEFYEARRPKLKKRSKPNA